MPISAILRDFLAEHLARVDREPSDRITLHECRHTFASLMIAAGVNAKALQTFMGHANVSITLDRYGHLIPGSEAEAAGLLDAYLGAERKRQEEAARAAGSGADWRTKWRTGGERVTETALECRFP